MDLKFKAATSMLLSQKGATCMPVSEIHTIMQRFCNPIPRLYFSKLTTTSKPQVWVAIQIHL